MSNFNNEQNGLSPDDLEALKKIQQEEERLYGTQSSMPFDDEFDSDTETLLDNSENPAVNKKLFYGLQSIINKNVSKGKLRDFINNEKKLYLKSLSDSGDSRFSFKNTLDELFNIADEWQRGDKNSFDLGMAFYNLNEKMNFHHPKAIQVANNK